MVIQPKIRGFICTTAHPEGCAANVRQMASIASKSSFGVTKRALVIGGSTGYGLASLATAAFSCHAKTIAVSFDKAAAPEKNRTATAGWYNLAAFANEAHNADLEHYAVIGDAFSDACKDATIQLIKEKFGKVDTVIYSLASPVRTDPDTGERYQSALKPVGEVYESKSLDLNHMTLNTVTLQPATEDEIASTVKVMGGADWLRWIAALKKADALEDAYLTIAYSYIGPELTHAIYKDGTIGRAKDDLQKAADALNRNGRAYLSVNKAVVTQASSAIPAVPLYISLLFNEMKARGTHEDCIEQIVRMFSKIASGHLDLDEQRRIRMDDWEMEPGLQALIRERWLDATPETLSQFADIQGYQNAFERLFGFGRTDVDYDADVDPSVPIAGAIVL